MMASVQMKLPPGRQSPARSPDLQYRYRSMSGSNLSTAFQGLNCQSTKLPTLDGSLSNPDLVKDGISNPGRMDRDLRSLSLKKIDPTVDDSLSDVALELKKYLSAELRGFAKINYPHTFSFRRGDFTKLWTRCEQDDDQHLLQILQRSDLYEVYGNEYLRFKMEDLPCTHCIGTLNTWVIGNKLPELRFRDGVEEDTRKVIRLISDQDRPRAQKRPSIVGNWALPDKGWGISVTGLLVECAGKQRWEGPAGLEQKMKIALCDTIMNYRLVLGLEYHADDDPILVSLWEIGSDSNIRRRLDRVQYESSSECSTQNKPPLTWTLREMIHPGDLETVLLDYPRFQGDLEISFSPDELVEMFGEIRSKVKSARKIIKYQSLNYLKENPQPGPAGPQEVLEKPEPPESPSPRSDQEGDSNFKPSKHKMDIPASGRNLRPRTK